MGIDDSLVREIVRRLLGVARPDRIILFGSAANGPMTRDSDIDLLIVAPTDDTPLERLKGSLIIFYWQWVATISCESVDQV
jgi:predicted nucleotidyltransferase